MFKLRDWKYKGHKIVYNEKIEPQQMVRIGVLTSKGELENADPKTHRIDADTFTLVATTNAQKVLSAKNLYHKQMLLMMKAGASTTSWDWIIKVAGFGQTARNLKNGKGGDLYYANAIASSGAYYEMLSNLPYGEDISIELFMDNNHATTDISIDATFYFFDPVR